MRSLRFAHVGGAPVQVTPLRGKIEVRRASKVLEVTPTDPSMSGASAMASGASASRNSTSDTTDASLAAKSGAALVASIIGGAALLRYGGFLAVSKQDTHRLEVLGMYRKVLRAALNWPSMKRAKVVTEIRNEFRMNAGEKDPQKLENMLADARSGLKQLLHDVAQNARLKATPSAPSWRRSEYFQGWTGDSSEDMGVYEQPQRGAERWALDELGVGASPTMSEAKTAYHERAKECHPDSGRPAADAEAFKRLKLAWEHVQQHLKRDVLRGQQGSKFR